MKKPALILFFAISCTVAFGQNLVPVKGENGKYGYKDGNGNLVVSYQYTYAGNFSEGLAYVKEKDKGYGFIDKDGKLVIPFRYESTMSFKEGLTAVQLNKKWGYIDKKGNQVIPFIYAYADAFSQGLATVEPISGQGYGYINKKGKMVIPAKFKYAYPFAEDGIALVSTKTKTVAHIDRTGKEINEDTNTILAISDKQKTATTSANTHNEERKNFAAELKALIDANTETIQGELISEEKIAGFTFRHYQCKLPLSGFDMEVTLGGASYIRGSYKGKASPAILDDIASKIAVFKKDYTILDSKTDKRLLEANASAEQRKILLVDDNHSVKAKIELLKIKQDGSPEMLVTIHKIKRNLSYELPKNTAPVQIGANFATELKALITGDVENIKGAKYDDDIITSHLSKFPLSGFDVKLKEVMGYYTVECKPDGAVSDATMDAIATKLAALKNSYLILDSKTKPELFDLKSGITPLTRRILVVDISENIKADIRLSEEYEKRMDFTIYKFDKPLRNR